MRVLVTGGGGFLGAATVRTLLARGDTAVAFDTRLAGLADRGGEPRLVRAPGDITDMANVVQAMMAYRPDAVVHCDRVELVRKGALDLSRAAAELGWKPRYDIRAGLAAYVDAARKAIRN
jgi:nucleoside-diphosphate-sugar epimerase